MTINFFVHGIPKPAGSKKAMHHRTTGKIIVMDDAGKPGRDWRKQVSEAGAVARDQRVQDGSAELLEGPLLLALTFYLKRPQGHFNNRGLKPDAPLYHTVKPDATKLTRAVEDALTGVLYKDDALIVGQSIQKRYCDEQHPHPGVAVYIAPYDEF